MRLNKKEWRIIDRALLKFTTTIGTTEDGVIDAPETNKEIDALWRKVHNHRREKGLLMADEKKRAP